ncbi:MFS transporter, DHA2 family, multidrug resistance protein [Sphingomonas sp. YR710]|uniref:MFS transporter n=1 Tax=Sphingomonas sp. YR710 TaxID=1882773 RepID=UPI00087EEFCB|nr:MFS transporter [Sphingomonas sp. YR710]SDC04953.1 MFS transporter, DHA2 family, multidrug resistance protein [Sphingomonas sp. YR710]
MTATSELERGLPKSRRLYAIAAVSLGTILTTISGSMISIALPTLARDLHVAPSAAVLVVTIYQLVLLMAMLPASALGDRIGHRVIYQYGLMIFVAATMLSFFARSLPFLVLVRGFQAVGAAGVLSVSSALIRSIYPRRQLGRGLSFNTVMAASFAAFAPTVGGAILSVASWPWLFVVLVPFGVFSILIGRRTLPDPVVRDIPFDVSGSVLCAATFGFVVTGLESGVHGDSPVISGALVLLGVAIGFVFVRRELGQERPMLPIDLLRQRDIALSSIALLVGYLSSMVIALTLPFRVQQGFHFSPAESGAVLSPWPIVTMMVAPLSGMLSDRYPAALLGAVGMVIAICGLVSLALLTGTPSHFDLIWRIMLCGMGYGMFFSPTVRQVVASAPMARTAAAGAVTTTTRGAGQTLGATAVATIFAAGLGTGAASAVIAAVLAAVAGTCSILLLRSPVLHVEFEDLPEI